MSDQLQALREDLRTNLLKQDTNRLLFSICRHERCGDLSGAREAITTLATLVSEQGVICAQLKKLGVTNEELEALLS